MTQPTLPGIPRGPLFTLSDGTPISQSAVNAAARRLRKHRGRASDSDIVNGFRKLFQYPQGKVWMGLRSFSRTEGIPDPEFQLTSRLKRYDRILAKLERYPAMALTNMQDIGGCRLVVPTLREQTRVVNRVQSQWESSIANVHDYRSGKESGYRAVHIVITRDGRLIECQIRTQIQQWWADEVEEASRQTGIELKWDPSESGDDLDPLRDSFRRLADLGAERDRKVIEWMDEGIDVTPLGFLEDAGDSGEQHDPQS